MSEYVSFDVLGHPEPAGSKKAIPSSRDWKTRPGVPWNVVDDNDKSKGWKKLVGTVASGAMLKERMAIIDGPCWCFITFRVKRPLTHYRKGGNLSAEGLRNPYPAKKPDVLKLARAVEDAMTGVVYTDDALIVSERIRKEYTDGPEGVSVTVTRL